MRTGSQRKDLSNPPIGLFGKMGWSAFRRKLHAPTGTPLLGSRIFAFGVLATTGFFAFIWTMDETGSSGLAAVGTAFVSLIVLLPLRCALDPCRT